MVIPVWGAMRMAAWAVFIIVAFPLWWLMIPLHGLRLLALRFGALSVARLLDVPHQLYVRWWSRIGLALIGVGVDVVSGSEHLTRKRGEPARVFCWNHSSGLDPIITSSLVSEAKYLFKAGFDMQAIAWIYTVPAVWSGHIDVARADPASRARCQQNLIRSVTERDNSVGIAPEGTRNKGDPAKLLPFKRGAFAVAIAAQRPIVPLVISHAENLWDKSYSRFLPVPGRVSVRVLDPVYPKEAESPEDFAERVRGIMQRSLDSPPPRDVRSTFPLSVPAATFWAAIVSAITMWLAFC